MAISSVPTWMEDLEEEDLIFIKKFVLYSGSLKKLAESYGAKGIRVFNKDQVAAAFEEAKKNTKVPTLIEFIIDPEEMVYPMVKPGGTLEDLIMDC